MFDEDFRERLTRAEAASAAALACNKLLLAAASLFACIALLLAGAFGFLLGKQFNTSQKQENLREWVLAADAQQRQHSFIQDPSQNVLQPRLGSRDVLKPLQSSHVQDLDSAKLDDAAQETAVVGVEADDSANIPEEPNLKHIPEALRAVYANYISRWQDDASYWNQPTNAVSRIGSRVASYASDASELIWQSSIAAEGRQPGLQLENSGAAPLSSHLMGPDWEIPSSQIVFCYTAKGNLVSLAGKDESSQVNLYKAVLDGKLDVAVRTLKLTKEAFPEEKLGELALQQLSLTRIQQLVHFYGISRTEDTIMLVYELIEGGNMRESIRMSPSSLGWYCNGKVVARDVAQGLASLHRRGMEHRSFKTTRILVRASDLTAKIADAGLQAVTRYCQQERNKRLVTSFEWAAPELLLGQRCGSEADIFSFGVAMWELVTQEMPIRGALREIRIPEECPAAIKTLINKCMAREPDMRPTADEVVATIQRAWNSSPGGGGRRRVAELASERPGLRKANSLRTAHSQPVTPTSTPRTRSPFEERLPWDSVSEMVDIRKGVPVRRGTLQSVQSAGGATSPSKFNITGEDRPVVFPKGKPPPSPNRSPDACRSGSPLSIEKRRLGSLDNNTGNLFRMRPFMTQHQAAAVMSASSSRRSSPIQRYMSGSPEPFPRRRQDDVVRERRRRAQVLHGIRSAPHASRSARGSDPPAERSKLTVALQKSMQDILNATRASARPSGRPKRDLAESLVSEASMTDIVEDQQALAEAMSKALREMQQRSAKPVAKEVELTAKDQVPQLSFPMPLKTSGLPCCGEKGTLSCDKNEQVLTWAPEVESKGLPAPLASDGVREAAPAARPSSDHGASWI